MYKNYIFDIYGTLIDINTDEGSKELWDKLALFYSFKGADYTGVELKNKYDNEIISMRKKYSDTEYPDFDLKIVFDKMFKDKGINVKEGVLEDTAQFFRILSIKHLRLYPGVIEFLEKLKSEGKKLYVLSNAQRVFTLYEMRLLGIEKYFDSIYFSADYNVCKPDRKFYMKLLEGENLKVKESIMIGNDYIADINGSSEVGLDSVYLHSNLSPEIEGKLKSTYTYMKMDFENLIEKII